jgi:ferric-dicitrate binding protein FerR (iron transport regulator)
MDNIQLLISRYIDGELTDEEIAELAAALQTDAASIDQLVFTSFIHAQLSNWMDQHGEQDPKSGTAFDRNERLNAMNGQPAQSPADDLKQVSAQTTSPSIGRARQRFFSTGALAAALLITASISVVAYVIASRPVIVGQVTDAIGCKWAASTGGKGVGALLESGTDLELIEGSAVITFASGAKLFLEGATSLHLNSAMDVRLDRGRIAAKVPRQAVGFAVTSSLARFVDLGTAFSLSLRAEKSFELYVFEGLVELQLDERFGQAVHQPVRVAQIHAVSFDVKSGDVDTLHFEEGKKMPF